MAKIVTLGCRLNQYDSARIGKLLEGRCEDIVIINTCTVTGNADIDARKAARKMKRENPGAKVILYGCGVKGNRRLFEGIKEIDHLVRDERELMAILALPWEPRVTPGFTGRTRALLKIQEGCDRQCSYCIVPIVRGRSRSRPPREVEDEFDSLLEAGYREIVLTGTHIGDFGKGLDEKTSLPDLIRRLLGKSGDFRLRLSSIEAGSISGELISTMAENRGRITEHLHVAVQSGSPKVLRDMNRDSDIAGLGDTIRRLEKEVPGIAIGADFINAFPTEGEKEFRETVKFIGKMPFAFLHVFTFSSRPGTVAFQFKPLAKEIVDERKKELMALAAEKRLGFYKKNEGMILRCLTLEGSSGRGKALSGNFIELSSDCRWEPNRFIDLRLRLDENGKPSGEEA